MIMTGSDVEHVCAAPIQAKNRVDAREAETG
jgi:hypothetical protein